MRPQIQSLRADELEKARILIVEDQPGAMKLVQSLLRDMGITQIFSAGDGQVALAFLDECEGFIDAVISDLHMPKVNGLDLLRQERTVYPRMPFLMITGRDTADAVKAARDSGVTAFLAKPFSPAQLETKIEAMLRRASV
ncbi:MAG: response regulator [Alphaproteobacteria bacterium]|nr:response regulator [Alphaproteobacteria bacterium]